MPTYSELKKEILNLTAEAERQRKIESAASLKEVKRLIAEFNFTAEDVGLTKSASKAGKKRPTSKRKVSRRGTGGSVKKVLPKYADSQGNTWTGRGKRPKWLEQALGTGLSLESFRISDNT